MSNINGAMLRAEIGARLRKERERLGYNQADFAALGGASKRSQIDWEQGKLVPNAEYLAAIAAAGADVTYVLVGETAVVAMTPDEKELLIGYRSLDLRGKAGVLGLLHGMESAAPKAVFHGDVGQVVQGDQRGDVGFSMGGTKKKKVRVPNQVRNDSKE